MSMQSFDNLFIPTEYAEELSRGSHEYYRKMVEEAVEHEVQRFSDDETVEVFTVNTFKTHAHVATSEGKLFKVNFDESEDELKISDVELMEDAPISHVFDMGANIRKNIGDLVDLFLEGKQEEAWNSLDSMVDLIDENTMRFGIKNVEHFVKKLKQESWRTYVQAKKGSLGDLLQIEESEVAPKFKMLYDGSLTEEECTEEMANAVEKSTDDLIEGFNTLAAELNEENLESVEGFDGMVDFFADLNESVGVMLGEARKLLELNDCVSCWAMIHDEIAEAFEDARVAKGFAKYFTKYEEGDGN